MNAFLAVRVARLPINSLEEIEEEKMTMLMWGSDALEEFLTETEVYKNANSDKRVQYIESTGKVIKMMLHS